jgi:hypothetical protein
MYRSNQNVLNVPFICGLGGEDITKAHINYAIQKIQERAEGKISQDTIWLNREVEIV